MAGAGRVSAAGLRELLSSAFFHLVPCAMPEPEKTPSVLELFAGLDPSGQPVMEKVPVLPGSEPGQHHVLKSPLFVRNLARGDTFQVDPSGQGRFRVRERSGYLALRVFRREGIGQVEEWLAPQVEKLEGSCDLATSNALVFSVHVNNGFAAIEQLFDNAASTFAGTLWYYGNVYDPKDGVTPLNWWDDFINQT